MARRCRGHAGALMFRLFVLVLVSSMLGGCAVVSVGTAAVGIAATGASIAVDAAVGTVKMTGRAVGAAADLVTGN
jgi:hypothetical protein